MIRKEAISRIQQALNVPNSLQGLVLIDEESANMAIEALSAEAKWIPCSERLPERDEIVLVSYKTTDTVHMCKYLDDGSENPWWSYNDDCLAWNNVILAWMPLPKPYKGGDSK